MGKKKNHENQFSSCYKQELRPLPNFPWSDGGVGRERAEPEATYTLCLTVKNHVTNVSVNVALPAFTKHECNYTFHGSLT